jgi:hypothetical protein
MGRAQRARKKNTMQELGNSNTTAVAAIPQISPRPWIFAQRAMV